MQPLVCNSLFIRDIQKHYHFLNRTTFLLKISAHWYNLEAVLGEVTLGEDRTMRRFMVCLFFALLLLTSVVGMRNAAVEQAGATEPIVLASGGAPAPPIPDLN